MRAWNRLERSSQTLNNGSVHSEKQRRSLKSWDILSKLAQTRKSVGSFSCSIAAKTIWRTRGSSIRTSLFSTLMIAQESRAHSKQCSPTFVSSERSQLARQAQQNKRPNHRHLSHLRLPFHSMPTFSQYASTNCCSSFKFRLHQPRLLLASSL